MVQISATGQIQLKPQLELPSGNLGNVFSEFQCAAETGTLDRLIRTAVLAIESSKARNGWSDPWIKLTNEYPDANPHPIRITMAENRDVMASVPLDESRAFQSLMGFYKAEARYSASGNGVDRTALLGTLHPDIVFYQPESLPYGGVWRGREAFGKWLDTFVRTWTGITPTDPVFHICGNDILISTVTMRAVARSTGIEIVMPMCQVIRFCDDLPIEWRNFAWDTAKMNDALKSAGSGNLAT